MGDVVATGRRRSGAGTDEHVVALQHELRDLYEEIADYLDDGQLERLPEYFTDDCMYQVISKENYDEGLPHATVYCDGVGMIKDRLMALRETQVYEPRALRHFISGVRVTELEADAVRARANFLITEAMSDREPRLLMVGRYIDTLVRRDGRLLFKQRLCVFDNYRIYQSVVVPV